MAISTTNIGAGDITTYVSTNDTALTFMSLCNRAASIVTCQVHLIPSGDLVTTDNLLFTDLEIQPGDTYIIYHGAEKILLSNGDYVSVNASTADTISVITSYMEI